MRDLVIKAKIILKNNHAKIKIIKPYKIIVPVCNDKISFNIGGFNVDVDFYSGQSALDLGENPDIQYVIAIEGIVQSGKIKHIHIVSKKILKGQVEEKYEDIFDNIVGRTIAHEIFQNRQIVVRVDIGYLDGDEAYMNPY